MYRVRLHSRNFKKSLINRELRFLADLPIQNLITHLHTHITLYTNSYTLLHTHTYLLTLTTFHTLIHAFPFPYLIHNYHTQKDYSDKESRLILAVISVKYSIWNSVFLGPVYTVHCFRKAHMIISLFG